MKSKISTLVIIALTLCLLPALHAQTPTPTPTPVGYVDTFKISTAAPLADRQARTAARLAQRMVSGESQLLMNYRALYNEVWKNTDGLTPQQVCDALGTKAANLFVIAGTMANALYQIDPVGIGVLVNVPTGWTNAIHADGTVILTYTPPTATPSPTP